MISAFYPLPCKASWHCDNVSVSNRFTLAILFTSIHAIAVCFETCGSCLYSAICMQPCCKSISESHCFPEYQWFLRGSVRPCPGSQGEFGAIINQLLLELSVMMQSDAVHACQAWR